MSFQSLENDEIIAHARADCDLLWLQAAIAVIEEYELPGAGLKDCLRRHDELAS